VAAPRNRSARTIVAAALIGLVHSPVAACPVPPAAVVEVPGIAFYTDARRSVRDPALFAANRQAMAPIDRYLGQIGRSSDAFLRGDQAAGRCTLVWLAAWAQAGALLGEPTSDRQARTERRFSVAAMALTALKVWDLASKGDRAVLQPYFRRLAVAVDQDAAQDRLSNNLLYWSGLVGMAIARLTGEARLAARAIAICRAATAGLTPRGSLPLEDRRGDRAIYYNGFALFPLSVMATLSGNHEPGCTVEDVQPLAHYVLANRNRTSDQFLRWAPFLGISVAMSPAALFYRYGGGSLDLVAKRLAAIARAPLP